MTALHELSASDLLRGYANRDFTPIEVVEALSARIEAVDPLLRAFATITLDTALTEARTGTERWRQGAARPLEGVPFGVKDLFDTGGIRTTYGSPIYDGHLPARDARAVARLREAGGILLGKTATDEFAYGIAGVNPHYGPVRNPWNVNRVSGGSSSGSGAAVAARCVPVALGSDTGGSIRSPSSFCGIVGFKGTWGAVSTEGMWAMGRTVDHAGGMARTPADVALLHRVLVEGVRGRPIVSSLERNPESVLPPDTRVGICPDLELIPLAADVRPAFTAAGATFERLGFPLRETRFRMAADVLSTFVPIRDAETLYTHRKAGLFPSRESDYSRLTFERLAAAQSVDLDEYLAALARRERLAEAFAALFADVDVLLAPLATATPPRIDSEQPDLDAWNALGLHMVLENLLGLPACAVRAGFDDDGLPVGIQLVGSVGSDALVLAAAKALFDNTPDVQDPNPPDHPDLVMAAPRGGRH